MCLIAWNWQPESARPLLLIGNRDEFYARPTRALDWWAPTLNGITVLAGQDLQAGGTWMGITADGRLAALTNVRSSGVVRPKARSRGELVAGFLQSSASADNYLLELQGRAADYNPFNLLVFDGQTLLGFHSPTQQLRVMHVGIGAVSNADFETPWPKLQQLHQGLQTLVNQQQLDADSLLDLLQNRQIAVDAQLPSTGIALEWERSLSATFIATDRYGTRASSLVNISAHQIDFTEVRYGPQGVLEARTAISQQRLACVG